MRPIDADVLKQHIDKLPALPDGNFAGNHSALKALINMQPTIQPEKAQHSQEGTTSDLISRQAVLDAIDKRFDDVPMELTTEILQLRRDLRELPSAQPEPLSDAYVKAVWTWLLDYRIKAAELKGRYTPYEVLSWVANDWRKEHER